MNAYARDLAAGDRAAIARRYTRGGAWFLGHGRKDFEPYARIEARYAGPEWTPPRSFAWRDLSIEPAGRDAVVVAGLGLWEPADGRPIVTLSYTALLLREDGELRIRLEDEFDARARAAKRRPSLPGSVARISPRTALPIRKPPARSAGVEIGLLGAGPPRSAARAARRAAGRAPAAASAAGRRARRTGW